MHVSQATQKFPVRIHSPPPIAQHACGRKYRAGVGTGCMVRPDFAQAVPAVVAVAVAAVAPDEPTAAPAGPSTSRRNRAWLQKTAGSCSRGPWDRGGYKRAADGHSDTVRARPQVPGVPREGNTVERQIGSTSPSLQTAEPGTVEQPRRDPEPGPGDRSRTALASHTA